MVNYDINKLKNYVDNNDPVGYYMYLKLNGCGYASLALGVASNGESNNFIADIGGLYAINYLKEKYFQYNGVELSVDKINDVKINLMKADFELRQLQENVTSDKIAEYHYAVFKKLGISDDAWTGDTLHRRINDQAWCITCNSDELGTIADSSIIIKIGTIISDFKSNFSTDDWVSFCSDAVLGGVFFKTLIQYGQQSSDTTGLETVSAIITAVKDGKFGSATSILLGLTGSIVTESIVPRPYLLGLGVGILRSIDGNLTVEQALEIIDSSEYSPLMPSTSTSVLLTTLKAQLPSYGGPITITGSNFTESVLGLSQYIQAYKLIGSILSPLYNDLYAMASSSTKAREMLQFGLVIGVDLGNTESIINSKVPDYSDYSDSYWKDRSVWLKAIAFRNVGDSIIDSVYTTGSEYLDLNTGISVYSEKTVGGSSKYLFGAIKYISSDSTSDTIYGNVAVSDYIQGGTNNDIINTGWFNDVIIGGLGADTMIGGAGDDTYYVDNPNDVVIEAVGEGTDTIISSATYRLLSNVENGVLDNKVISGVNDPAGITLFGNELDNTLSISPESTGGNNTLVGGDGNDTLKGADGGNVLIGGEGDDIIEGCTGNKMNGGNGYDIYKLKRDLQNAQIYDADSSGEIWLTRDGSTSLKGSQAFLSIGSQSGCVTAEDVSNHLKYKLTTVQNGEYSNYVLNVNSTNGAENFSILLSNDNPLLLSLLAYQQDPGSFNEQSNIGQILGIQFTTKQPQFIYKKGSEAATVSLDNIYQVAMNNSTANSGHRTVYIDKALYDSIKSNGSSFVDVNQSGSVISFRFEGNDQLNVDLGSSADTNIDLVYLDDSNQEHLALAHSVQTQTYGYGNWTWSYTTVSNSFTQNSSGDGAVSVSSVTIQSSWGNKTKSIQYTDGSSSVIMDNAWSHSINTRSANGSTIYDYYSKDGTSKGHNEYNAVTRVTSGYSVYANWSMPGVSTMNSFKSDSSGYESVTYNVDPISLVTKDPNEYTITRSKNDGTYYYEERHSDGSGRLTDNKPGYWYATASYYAGGAYNYYKSYSDGSNINSYKQADGSESISMSFTKVQVDVPESSLYSRYCKYTPSEDQYTNGVCKTLSYTQWDGFSYYRSDFQNQNYSVYQSYADGSFDRESHMTYDDNTVNSTKEVNYSNDVAVKLGVDYSYYYHITQVDGTSGSLYEAEQYKYLNGDAMSSNYGSGVSSVCYTYKDGSQHSTSNNINGSYSIMDFDSNVALVYQKAYDAIQKTTLTYIHNTTIGTYRESTSESGYSFEKTSMANDTYSYGESKFATGSMYYKSVKLHTGENYYVSYIPATDYSAQMLEGQYTNNSYGVYYRQPNESQAGSEVFYQKSNYVGAGSGACSYWAVTLEDNQDQLFNGNADVFNQYLQSPSSAIAASHSDLAISGSHQLDILQGHKTYNLKSASYQNYISYSAQPSYADLVLNFNTDAFKSGQPSSAVATKYGRTLQVAVSDTVLNLDNFFSSDDGYGMSPGISNVSITLPDGSSKKLTDIVSQLHGDQYAYVLDNSNAIVNKPWSILSQIHNLVTANDSNYGGKVYFSQEYIDRAIYDAIDDLYSDYSFKKLDAKIQDGSNDYLGIATLGLTQQTRIPDMATYGWHEFFNEMSQRYEETLGVTSYIDVNLSLQFSVQAWQDPRSYTGYDYSLAHLESQLVTSTGSVISSYDNELRKTLINPAVNSVTIGLG